MESLANGFADGTVVAAASTPLDVFLAIRQFTQHPFVIRLGHEDEPWHRIRRAAARPFEQPAAIAQGPAGGGI
jgi:hypothetical protein